MGCGRGLVHITARFQEATHGQDTVGWKIDVEVVPEEAASVEESESLGSRYETVTSTKLTKELWNVRNPPPQVDIHVPLATKVRFDCVEGRRTEASNLDEDIGSPVGADVVDCVRVLPQEELLEWRQKRACETLKKSRVGWGDLEETVSRQV